MTFLVWGKDIGILKPRTCTYPSSATRKRLSISATLKTAGIRCACSSHTGVNVGFRVSQIQC